MVDDINRKAERRLKEWGNWWYRTLTSPATGYPTKSIEGKLVEGGGLLIRGTADMHIPINLDADEIDEMVGQLLSDKAEEQSGIVLRVNYILRGGQKRKAHLLNMSRMQYQYYLKSAKMYIAGRLVNNERKSGYGSKARR